MDRIPGSKNEVRTLLSILGNLLSKDEVNASTFCIESDEFSNFHLQYDEIGPNSKTHHIIFHVRKQTPERKIHEYFQLALNLFESFREIRTKIRNIYDVDESDSFDRNARVVILISRNYDSEPNMIKKDAKFDNANAKTGCDRESLVFEDVADEILKFTFENHKTATFATKIEFTTLLENQLNNKANNKKLQDVVKIFLKNFNICFKSYTEEKLDECHKILHYASEFNSLSVVKFLTNLNTKIDALNKNGQTALHIAAKMGHATMVEQLIRYRANVNCQDPFGRTPLHYAAENGHSSIASILVRCYADVSVEDHRGRTALYLAALNGYVLIVKLLCNDKSSWTSLHFAAVFGSIDISMLMCDLESSSINKKNADGDLPLHLAAQHGYVEIVEILLNKSQKINSKNGKRQTALHLASKHGHLKIVELLLDRKLRSYLEKNVSVNLRIMYGSGIAHFKKNRDLNVNGVDVDGRTPLYFATMHNHVKIVEILLQRSADASISSINKLTPLLIACQKGYIEIVELLLKSGANVNEIGPKGQTALHLATWNEHPKVVELLLEHNADCSIHDDNKDIPLHLAFRKGCKPIFELLLELQTLKPLTKSKRKHQKSIRNHSTKN